MNPLQADKILSYYHEAKQILAGNIQAPRMVSCWLTTVCNYNCSFCLFKQENHEEHVIADAGQFMKFIDDIVKAGVKSLEFSGGGEPTMHPAFEEIVCYAHSKGLKLGLFTNGSKPDVINPKLFRYIRISLDAADSDTYYNIKNPPTKKAFELVLKKTEALIESRGTNSRPRIGFKFVINNQNYKDISDMIDVGEKVGVDYVQFKAEHSSDHGLTDQQASECEVDINNLKLVHKDKPFILGSVKRKKSLVKCFMSPIHTVIDPKGDVFVCCYLRDKERILGNAFETPFTEFWGNVRHKEIIKNISINECQRVDCRWSAYNKKMKEVISDDEIDIDFI